MMNGWQIGIMTYYDYWTLGLSILIIFYSLLLYVRKPLSTNSGGGTSHHCRTTVGICWRIHTATTRCPQGLAIRGVSSQRWPKRSYERRLVQPKWPAKHNSRKLLVKPAPWWTRYKYTMYNDTWKPINLLDLEWILLKFALKLLDVMPSGFPTPAVHQSCKRDPLR